MPHTKDAEPDVAGTATGATELVRYEAACRALAEARSVDEVKDIRDRAMAMRLYAKQAKNKDLEADAFELRVRAERRLGEMIAEQKATYGLATGGQPYQRKSTGSAAAPVAAPPAPTLAETGIDKKLSARAQKLNAIPPAKFEAMVKDGRNQVQRGAEKRIIREVQRVEARASYEARTERGGTVDDLHALVAAGKRFAVILADPPWKFIPHAETGEDLAENHYRTMPLDEIKALPVGALAAKDCVLLLWGVWPQLLGVLDVIKAWGFTFKTVGFVWAKQGRSGTGWHIGQGYYTRANTEFCLLATRGAPQRFAMDVRQLVVSPVMEHSAKPDEIHDRVERLLVGPYLELFARAERPPGWYVWGNEVATTSALADDDDEEPWDGTFRWADDDEMSAVLRVPGAYGGLRPATPELTTATPPTPPTA
jgi:N6-adenosine-specific RNA methylase IME4